MAEKLGDKMRSISIKDTTKRPVRVMICSYLHSFWLENYGIPKSAYEKGKGGPDLKKFVNFSRRLSRGRVSMEEFNRFEQDRVERMVATIQMMQKHKVDIINVSEASNLLVTKLVENGGWVTDIRDGGSAMDAIVSQPSLLSCDELEQDTSGVTATPPTDRVGTCILLSPNFFQDHRGGIGFVRHTDDDSADVGGFAGVFISSLNTLFLTMKLEGVRKGSQGSKGVLDTFAKTYRIHLDKSKILAGGDMNLLWDKPRPFDKKKKSTITSRPFSFTRIGPMSTMPTYFGSGTNRILDYWVGKGFHMSKCFLPKEIFCAWESCNGDISVLFNKSLELFGSDHSWLAAEFVAFEFEEDLPKHITEYFLIDIDGNIEPLNKDRMI